MSARTQGVFVFGLAVLVYLTSLPGAFHYDDHASILLNPAVRDASEAPRYFTDPSAFSAGGAMYRPVLLLSYLQDYLVAGYRPLTWHSTNVLLHGLVAFLVVLLAAALLRTFRREELKWAPLLAGLVFALHPVHSEVVNYVSSRSSALATAGVLGALLCHLRWRETGRKRHLLGALLLFALGLGAKEIAVALVPIVLLLELLDRRGAQTALARTAPLLAVTALYLGLRHVLLGSVAGDVGARLLAHPGVADPHTGAGRTVFQNLLTQARVLWRYVALVLRPARLAVDHDVRVSTSLLEPAVLAALAGLAALVALLARQAPRRPLAVFAVAFFLLALLPTSSLVPLNVVMNEHRLYLPGVGFALLAGAALARRIERRPRAGIALAAALAALSLAIVIPRNRVWQSPEALWESNVAVAPGSHRARNELGKCYAERARGMGRTPEARALLDRAIGEFEAARRIYPRWALVDRNLGLAWSDRARITGAAADWETARRHFRACGARYPIAMAYAGEGRLEDAIRELEGDRARHLLPLAQLTGRAGRFDEAEALYREALASEPDDPYAYVGLADLLATRDRAAEGRAVLDRLLARRPQDPGAHLALARFLRRTDPAAAASAFAAAVRLGHEPFPGERERYLDSP